MSTNEIMIPRNYLKALAMCAPKTEVRRYMCGVHVSAPAGEGWAHLAATNGHYMVIGRTESLTADPVSVIIPQAVAAQEGKGKDGSVILTHDGNTWRLGNTLFAPVDGKFPDYWHLIPRGVSGGTAQFNPEYLALVDKAIRTWTGSKSPSTLHHNGATAPALMLPQQEQIDIIGLVMPVRTEYDCGPHDCGLHDWPELAPAEPDRKTA